jgi:hypothetical protein
MYRIDQTWIDVKHSVVTPYNQLPENCIKSYLLFVSGGMFIAIRASSALAYEILSVDM